jgi:hypothetical protein
LTGFAYASDDITFDPTTGTELFGYNYTSPLAPF